MKIISINNDDLLFPWKLYICYFCACFLIFLFGPWKYSNINFPILFVFLTLYLLISSIAYNHGINKAKTHAPFKKDIPIILLKIIIIASLIVLSFMLLFKIQDYGMFSMSNIFHNMALAYSNTRNSSTDVVDKAMQLFNKVGFIIYISQILGYYYFKSIDKKYQILIIFESCLIFIFTMCYLGQQKVIGDFTVIYISVFMAKMYKKINSSKLSKKILFILLIILIVILFASILSSRLEMMKMSVGNLGSNLYYLDTSFFLFKIFPYQFALGLVEFMFYCSHGFYGLSLCLNEPFVWTHGLGGFPVIDTLLNIDSSKILTYPVRVAEKTSWSAKSVWHTIFPWLASDFTFLGSIIIISICAYIYAISWYEIVNNEKWQSILMFSMLNIIWVYSIANNQLFMSKATFALFFVVSILWLLRNKKVIVRKRKV